jgi:hypothetical protein
VGRWTVLASCGRAGGGSLVASLGDNWLSVDDLSRGTSSVVPRSWIVLRSPITRRGIFYIILDWYHASYEYICQWYFTKYLPDLSTLVTNARPSPTGNEWVHANSRIIYTGYFAYRTYMVNAHDGSFVFGHLIGGNDGTWHSFKCATFFNILHEGSYPSWDMTQAVSFKYDLGIVVNSDINFQSLHIDGSQCNLQPVNLCERQETNWSCEIHNDDLRDGSKIICWPPQLVSVDTGKKCWRGLLEDLPMVPKHTNDGNAVFKNGSLCGVRFGAFIVPVTRNLVVI